MNRCTFPRDEAFYLQCYRDAWRNVHDTDEGFVPELYARSAARHAQEHPGSVVRVLSGDTRGRPRRARPRARRADPAAAGSACCICCRSTAAAAGRSSCWAMRSGFTRITTAAAVRLHVSENNARAIDVLPTQRLRADRARPRRARASAAHGPAHPQDGDAWNGVIFCPSPPRRCTSAAGGGTMRSSSAATHMSTTRASARRSSAACSRPRACAWPCSRSRTGTTRRPSAPWAGRGWACSSARAISTPWSRTTRRPSAAAARIFTPPASAPAAGPTARPSSTATARARPSAPTCRSSSARSRRACAASRTTITGTIPSAAPSSSTPRPTCWSTAWARPRRSRSLTG